MTFPRHLKRMVGKKRGWWCEICHRKWVDGWIIEAHHVIPTFAGGQDTELNCRLLCLEHHYHAHLELRHAGIDHPASANIVKRRWEQTKGRYKT